MVSGECNLARSCCYFSYLKGKPRGIRAPSHDVLEKWLGDYLRTCGPVASILRKGGKALLLGSEFFHRAMEMEVRHALPHVILSNSVKTH